MVARTNPRKKKRYSNRDDITYVNYMLVGEMVWSKSRRIKRLGIISIILIVGISYALFFYLQSITENNIKNRLFDEQKQKQLDSTKAIQRRKQLDKSKKK